MPFTVTIYEDRPPIQVGLVTQLETVLGTAAEEARKLGRLVAILLAAENKNEMTIVLGGQETVLGFDRSGSDPGYYASKGLDPNNEPIMTCFLNFKHHTEFSRRHVIPLRDGLRAVEEFFGSGELPNCVEWELV